ncbi:MAG: hypothetical protein AABX74_06025 [Nanoarchaeota archaeon]
MKEIGKKAFIFRIIHFIIIVIVIILLVFLIQNDWDVNASVNEFLGFFS